MQTERYTDQPIHLEEWQKVILKDYTTGAWVNIFDMTFKTNDRGRRVIRLKSEIRDDWHIDLYDDSEVAGVYRDTCVHSKPTKSGSGSSRPTTMGPVKFDPPVEGYRSDREDCTQCGNTLYEYRYRIRGSGSITVPPSPVERSRVDSSGSRGSRGGATHRQPSGRGPGPSGVSTQGGQLFIPRLHGSTPTTHVSRHSMDHDLGGLSHTASLTPAGGTEERDTPFRCIVQRPTGDFHRSAE